MMSAAKSPETIAAANGIGEDTAFGSLTSPLYLSSSFRFPGFDRPGPYKYSRAGNPTRDQLADTLARLEVGVAAVITASGMAAVDLVLWFFSSGSGRCGDPLRPLFFGGA
jgi:cystathionine gamma-synthase